MHDLYCQPGWGSIVVIVCPESFGWPICSGILDQFAGWIFPILQLCLDSGPIRWWRATQIPSEHWSFQRVTFHLSALDTLHLIFNDTSPAHSVKVEIISEHVSWPRSTWFSTSPSKHASDQPTPSFILNGDYLVSQVGLVSTTPPFELIPGHLSLNTTSIIGAIPLQTQSQVNIISFPIEIPWKSHRSPMEIHFPPSWILFCTDTKCSAGVFATPGVSGDLRGELFGNIWEWKVCYIYKYIVYRVYVYIYMYRITIYIYIHTIYIHTIYIYALYIYIYIIIITFKYYIYIYYIYYIHTLYDFNTIYDFFYDIELT